VQLKPALFRRYAGSHVSGSLYCGDALAFLKGLKSEIAGIVFLDPPFNLRKDYGAEDRGIDDKDEAEYLDWMTQILTESVRVLMPGGALYLYHLPYWAMRLGSVIDQRLTFRHWIAIAMKNGFARGDRLYPAHYGMLYFTKGEPVAFHRPKLRPAKCRHCGKLVKNYGGYTPIIEEKGINLSDFWDDLSPVRHRGTKLRAANQLPMRLTERVVKTSGQPGMVFVDPFAGTGSGVLAAVAAGMRFRATDIVQDNCEIINTRLQEFRTSIHQPS
jgi:site-specific DNA-methyltransferase (adenine-specific)